MANGQYTALAAFYDRLNGADYKRYAQALCQTLARYGVRPGHLVLDLACGTGQITARLAKAGYDMIGVDLSEEMLAVAMNRPHGEKPVLYLKQDMRAFELYGTVAATVCCLDSLNYLCTEADLAACFACVHNYLDPNGIFAFDMNTPYQFENGYGKHDYVMEADGVLLAWRSCYHKASRLCDFHLSLFSRTADGHYTRTEELQTERAFSMRTVRTLLTRAGFEILEENGSYQGDALQAEDAKRFFVCRCVKAGYEQMPLPQPVESGGLENRKGICK